MVAMNFRELRQLKDICGPQQTCEHIRESFAAGDLKSEDFSIRELAEAILGYEVVRDFDPKLGGNTSFSQLRESGSATDSSAFTNISGQIVINALMERFNRAPNIASGLVRTIPTRLQNGEKLPMVTWMNTTSTGVDTDEVGEAMPYPRLGLAESYVETP
ncbi:MAG: hypothetical protein ACYSWU_23555, partial [Planctomycetota bacterium]